MLDLFFRKYAWTANLVLLFAAAWLTAKTVNTLVSVGIRPDPRAGVATPAPAPPRPTLPVALDTNALFRLIGQQPPPSAEEEAAAGTAAAPRNCDDPGAPPTRTDMRVQLVASVVAEKPRFSLATIADLNARETHVLGIGDQVAGLQLLALERVRDDRDATGNGFRVVAIVCNGGTKEYLDFDPGAGQVAGAENVGYAPVPPKPMAPAPSGPAGKLAGVRQLTDNRYEIEKNVIDSTFSDLNRIATQARIVPSFKNGVANGFKLFSIQPNSLYASIGIENGDVIQRVNGYEINSPDKALELYQKLRESPHVTIELERAGQTIRKEYNVSGR
jgi:general secretion pathway protein C